jgi:GT2 family glycosyltransferase
MNNIQVLTVNYNTPDLILNLVSSFRKFYDNSFLIVDGSDQEKYNELKELLKDFENIEIHHFDFNIHHGMGLTYGFKFLKSKQILILDSDVTLVNKGFLEDLFSLLPKVAYGIGDCQFVDEKGFNIGSRRGAIGLKESEMTEGGYRYLHPAFMLINREVALQWPTPINHGAPMIETMIAITIANKQNLLIHSDWVYNDNRNEPKIYMSHNWMGTVSRTGGYNL